MAEYYLTNLSTDLSHVELRRVGDDLLLIDGPLPDILEAIDFHEHNIGRRVYNGGVSYPAEENTDGGDWQSVLAAIRSCSANWVGDARLLGNVRAEDITRAVTEVLDRDKTVQYRKELVDKLQSGWDCLFAPGGKCEYDDDPDHCIHCGEPEERK